MSAMLGRRRTLGTLVALVAGLAIGGLLTTALQGTGLPLDPGSSRPVDMPSVPDVRPEAPETFLAWVPGGLPAGFGRTVAALPGVGRVTVVAEDNTWMTRSWGADGALVDRPRRPYLFPIDAAAVRPRSFAPFLPPADRGLLLAVQRGQGLLGATSARLRGLGPGSALAFAGGVRVRIAGVLPDELVGAAELLVSRPTGTRIGVTRDRYALMQPSPGARLTSRALLRRLQSAIGGGPARVRAPGETPYFRSGDAVLPPVLIKALFGEFAARPEPGRPGYLDVDPSWADARLVTAQIPLLGRVTCNRAIVPQLRGAMRELRAAGRADLIRSYHGCFAPRFINRDPAAMISHHAWGIAFDVNLAGNAFGDPPHQDPELVRVLARWGFVWGGTFVVPDGNHFEYRRPPLG